MRIPALFGSQIRPATLPEMRLSFADACMVHCTKGHRDPVLCQLGDGMLQMPAGEPRHQIDRPRWQTNSDRTKAGQGWIVRLEAKIAATAQAETCHNTLHRGMVVVMEVNE